MTACALGAIRLYPASQDYMIFTHCGDEAGHKMMLDIVDANPLLHLGLRLGEGTGALCAFPIVDSAVRMMNEMNNFDNAKITKYFWLSKTSCFTINKVPLTTVKDAFNGVKQVVLLRVMVV